MSPIVIVAVFFLSVVLTSLGVGRLMPPPEYFREKLTYFAEHKDEFDLVFFGASETHWGLSPATFDDQLSKHGIPMRSFNLAVPGSNGYEIDHMIRHVLRMEPARLKYAVISWRAWRLDREPKIHRRQIWWHSLAETVLLFRGLWLDRLSWDEKLKAARVHAEDAFRKFAHLGLGRDLIRYWMDPPGPGRGKWDYLAKTGGFEGLTDETDDRFWPQGVELREKFLKNTDAFVEETLKTAQENLRAREEQRAREDPYLATLFPRLVYSMNVQVELLERHGVAPVYLIPPTNESGHIQRRLETEGYIPALLAFDDPLRYPALFEVEHRYDRIHLTEAGSQLYSRHVADRFAELLRTGGLEGSAPAP